MSKNLGPVVAGDGCDHLTGAPLRRTAGGIPRYQPLPAAQGLILTRAQAEAAYTAMCALNNANLWVEDIIDAEPAAVLEHVA